MKICNFENVVIDTRIIKSFKDQFRTSYIFLNRNKKLYKKVVKDAIIDIEVNLYLGKVNKSRYYAR